MVQDEKITSLEEKVGDLSSKQMFEQFKTDVKAQLEEQAGLIANQEERIVTQEEKSVEQDLKIARLSETIVKQEETIAEQQKTIAEQNATIQKILGKLLSF